MKVALTPHFRTHSPPLAARERSGLVYRVEGLCKLGGSVNTQIQLPSLQMKLVELRMSCRRAPSARIHQLVDKKGGRFEIMCASLTSRRV